jgi:hypothetical protein
MALTATATAQVQADICTQLRLREPVLYFRAPCFRPNLYYDVMYRDALANTSAAEVHLAEFAMRCLNGHPMDSDSRDDRPTTAYPACLKVVAAPCIKCKWFTGAFNDARRRHCLLSFT